MQKLTVLLVIFISIMVISNHVSAEQIVYQDFELSLNIYHDSTDVAVGGKYGTLQTVHSFTISFPTPRYIAGVTLDFSISTDQDVTNDVYIYVNGNQISSKSFTGPISDGKKYFDLSQTIYGTTFTIEIKTRLDGYYDQDGNLIPSYLALHDVWIYSAVEPVKLRSYLEELKYFPPGADNTPQGFILNQTALLLNQSYNLSTGTISFYLKWDGTKNIKLSDSIGIDDSGYLYIKNDAGTTYTLEGVTLPVGVYVPVYIGWKLGEGYIMVNTTKISLNWAGNLIISKIGDLNTNSATIIDEFKLWNTYIPSDLVSLASQTQEYHVLVSEKTINIAPEGGTTLGVVDVTFLGQNYTALNTTTLSQGSSVAVAPNGTVAIVLSRSGISRTYWLGNYSTITFPAEDAKLIVTHITVTPEQFDYLTVKTISGKVATRIKLQDNQGDFAAVYGAQYIFTFEKGNITRSRVYTVATSNLVFYITTSQYALQPPLDFQAYYDKNTRLVWILFEDASGGTKWLNITLTGYQNYAPAWKIHDFENRSYGLYIMTANSTDTDYVVVKLTANINGSTQTFERTVYVGTNGATRPPFPVTLVPPAFIMLVSALLGIFVFPGSAPALMLLGGATSLGIVTILGWIPAVPGLIATLTLLGVLALVIHRRD